MTLSMQEIENANGPSYSQVDNRGLLREFVEWWNQQTHNVLTNRDVDKFLAQRNSSASLGLVSRCDK